VHDSFCVLVKAFISCGVTQASGRDGPERRGVSNKNQKPDSDGWPGQWVAMES
jgi:hypothetical protein